jgi:mRNA interferase MazF
MEKFVKGDIIVFHYPFSDYTSQKRRPALVIATPKGNDIIVCQITSQVHIDNYSIELNNDDFIIGSLNLKSYIRPNKIISIDKDIIIYKVGNIANDKLNEIVTSIIEIIKN